MGVDEIKELISTFGFPVVVAIYLLWERKTIMSEMTKSIVALTEMCGKIYNRIDGEKKDE